MFLASLSSVNKKKFVKYAKSNFLTQNPLFIQINKQAFYNKKNIKKKHTLKKKYQKCACDVYNIKKIEQLFCNSNISVINVKLYSKKKTSDFCVNALSLKCTFEFLSSK